MESVSVKWLLLGVMIWVQIHRYKGCFDEERLALLQFKASLASESDDDDPLPSWVDNPKSSNCCEWNGVTCNYTTGHVIELFFNGINYGDCHKNSWLVNMSIFRHIKELTSLDLSGNRIGGLINIKGLKKLETLNLNDNCLNNASILFSSLGALTSLKTLVLEQNSMSSFPTREIGNLENLEMLHLSDNNFNSSPPIQDLKRFPKLFKLKDLDLSWNSFPNDLSFLSIFPSLQRLDLSFNRMNSPELWNQGLCRLNRLEELDLQDNDFEGSILPECLHNLTSLRILDLSRNNFTGKINSSWLANLISLEYIDLSDNHFEGSFSFKECFSNHSSLEFVQLTNNDKLKVVAKYPNWAPYFQLQILGLQNCDLDSIPEFLFRQSELKMVDLSHNRICSSFPNWFFKNNTRLEHLNVKNNSFVGEFPSPGENCKLAGLDLSYNNFTGEVPEKLVSSCISLLNLKLSHNNFHGQIFTGFNLTSLQILQLNDNQFTGTLSSLGTKLDELIALDLGNNRFHGEIHGWIGNLTSLEYLVLQNNYFKGQISCELLKDLVDLSYNNFSGPLPSCFNLSYSSVHLNLQSNIFTGSIPEAFLNSSQLVTLNLRHNRLSGSIPNRFGVFPNLRILSLAGNHLNGVIPNWLCQLSAVSLLDLSKNSFSGSIPHCLHNLSFGSIKASDAEFNLGIVIMISHSNPATVRESLTHGGLVSFEFKTVQVTEFVTKHRSETYKGDILNYMYGLDLSDNNLKGEIPDELGKLSQIRALNLSHNQLTGSIPKSFSKFFQIESMDLSYNNLSGEIPLELTNLNSLAVFSVAHNNLSGKTPDRKGQFITFDNSSYDGNPLLCGPPLRDCHDNESAPSPNPLQPEEVNGKWYEIDNVVFFASFSASFAMFFFGVITFLYVNPYWRRWLFYHCEEFMFSCYYFMYDNLFKFFVR